MPNDLTNIVTCTCNWVKMHGVTSTWLPSALTDKSYVFIDWMKTKVEIDAITLHESLIHRGMQDVAMEIFCTRSSKVIRGLLIAGFFQWLGHLKSAYLHPEWGTRKQYLLENSEIRIWTRCNNKLCGDVLSTLSWRTPIFLYCLQQVKAIRDAYRRLYGSTVSETAKEKFKSGYWKQLLVSLSQNDRDGTTAVSPATANSNATRLYEVRFLEYIISPRPRPNLNVLSRYTSTRGDQ